MKFDGHKVKEVSFDDLGQFARFYLANGEGYSKASSSTCTDDYSLNAIAVHPGTRVFIKDTAPDPLAGYEAIEWFYPYYSMSSDDEMQHFIRAHQMRDDPTGMFYMTSVDHYFVMVFESANHERDSSNDKYTVYRRKMSGR
jgi:hypothetical protein